MGIIWILVPAAILMGLLFLGVFIWAARNGQFEDLETPAVRILFEDQVGKKGEEK